MPEPTGRNSVRRRSLVAALLAALPVGPPVALLAQPSSPQAFLESIYRPYLAKDFKGQPYSEADRFFAPDLANAMVRDMRGAAQKGEVPLLNGDPFLDAQDWEITKLTVSATANGDQASGVVTFENFGKPVRLALALVQTSAGWRIADIEAPSGSLRALYKLK